MAPELRTERELSLDFLRVTEAAAIAAARTMGQGDRKYSDQVAVEAMREVMDTVPMRGRVVIGEGERDEAPMLFIGEEVGGGFGVGEEMAASCPEVDIAVDPLEGTNLCALGANNAIAVLAAAERGIPVFEYGPHEVKLAVTGYGRAAKDQVQRMVGALLSLPEPPEPEPGRPCDQERVVPERPASHPYPGPSLLRTSPPPSHPRCAPSSRARIITSGIPEDRKSCSTTGRIPRS